MTPKKLYRVVAISRAITWTLLFAGLIMRATTGFAPVDTIGAASTASSHLAPRATAVLTAVNQALGCRHQHRRCTARGPD